MLRTASQLGSIYVCLSFCVLVGPASADLLVSSRDSDSILRYDETTGAYLGDFVSAGSGGLSQPVGMRTGPDGNLYVSSFGTNQILRYNGKTGAFIDVFVNGNGLSNPADLRFGPDGALYVANFGDVTVTRYNGSSGAPAGTLTGTQLANPTSLLFDSFGRLLTSSFGTDLVMRYSLMDGQFVPFAAGGLSGPSGLAIGPDDDLYVASLLGWEIRKFDGLTGAAGGSFAGTGTFSFPADILFTNDGRLLATSAGLDSILSFDAATGAPLGVFTSGNGLKLPAQMLLHRVPEPATAGLAAMGLAMLAMWRIKRSRVAAVSREANGC